MRDAPKRYPYKGEMLTARQLSELSGINAQTLRNRIERMGMTAEEAVNTPARGTHLYKDEWKTIKELAELAGIKPNTLSERLHKGWSVEEAVETPYLVDEQRRQHLAQRRVKATPKLTPKLKLPKTEKHRMLAAQQIARTVTTPNLYDWDFRYVMPGVYAFDGTEIAWEIVFGRNDRAHLLARRKKDGRQMRYDRVFEIRGETVKEIMPEWRP